MTTQAKNGIQVESPIEEAAARWEKMAGCTSVIGANDNVCLCKHTGELWVAPLQGVFEGVPVETLIKLTQTATNAIGMTKERLKVVARHMTAQQTTEWAVNAAAFELFPPCGCEVDVRPRKVAGEVKS